MLMTLLLPLIGTLCQRPTDIVKKKLYKATLLAHADKTAE